MQGIAPAFFCDRTATLQMQVRVNIYFRTATPDTQVKFEKGHREAEKQKNKEKEDTGKQYGREIKTPDGKTIISLLTDDELEKRFK